MEIFFIMILRFKVFVVKDSECVDDLFIIEIFIIIWCVLFWVDVMVCKELFVDVWVWWDFVLKLFVILSIVCVFLCMWLVFFIVIWVVVSVFWDFCSCFVLLEIIFCIVLFKWIDCLMVVLIWIIIGVLDWYKWLVWLR